MLTINSATLLMLTDAYGEDGGALKRNLNIGRNDD